jgi:hypothetical protein
MHPFVAIGRAIFYQSAELNAEWPGFRQARIPERVAETMHLRVYPELSDVTRFVRWPKRTRLLFQKPLGG